MIKVAIIGAGVLGQHIEHYLTEQCDDNIRVSGFYDDIIPAGTIVNSSVVLGNIDNVELQYRSGCFNKLIIGIGYKHLTARHQLYQRFKASIPFFSFIHPTVFVDSSVKIGEGVVIFPGGVLDKNVKICDNVFLHIGSIVAHDSTINENCFFGPAVKVAGFVEIGSHCFLGIDTTVIDNVIVSPHVQTGGGTVITENIVEPGLYVGTPARKLKTFTA